MNVTSATLVCQREHNEDSLRIPEPLEAPALFLVADGMGGANAGEVASNLAVEACAAAFLAGRASTARRLESAWLAANKLVFEAAERYSRLRGMGTTLTGLYLAVGHDRGTAGNAVDAWVAHVGDSRCYGLRAGDLVQFTEDHTAVARAVRDGYMSEADAATSVRRNVLDRAVGPSRHVAVDVRRVRGVEPGDVFLLCSDGVTGTLSDDLLLDLLTEGAGAAEVCAAAEALGASDNCTAIVVRV